MNLRDLVAHIGFEVDEKPLERVEQLLEGIHHKLEFLAGVEIAHKLFEVSEKFAHWGSEINTTAENLGMATDELQMLQFAAQKSGVGADEMSHSLALLSRKLQEARNGSKEASLSFARAGFTSEQVSTFKNAEEALFAFSDILRKTEDPIKRTAIAQEFLGRSGGKFVTFLKQGPAAIRDVGNEMKKLGLVLSGGQLHALEETEYSFQKLFGVFRGLGAIIAATVGPSFSFLIDKFLEFYAANRKIIETNISKWLYSFTYGLGFVFGLLLDITKLFLKFAKALGIQDDILKFTGWIGGAAGSLLAMAKAFQVVTGFLGSSAEFLAFAAAVGAIAVAAHDVWAAMNGKPTWIGQIVDWVKDLGPVKEFLNSIKDGMGNVDGTKLAKSLESTLDRLKVKMGELSKGDFLENLVDDDKVYLLTTKLKKAIDDALIVTGFFFTAGLEIAKGVIEGLKNEFGFNKVAPGMEKFAEAKTPEAQGAALRGAMFDSAVNGITGFLKWMGEGIGASGGFGGVGPVPFFQQQGNSPTTINQTNQINTTVHSSTDPKEHAAIINDHVTKFTAQIWRQADLNLSVGVV